MQSVKQQLINAGLLELGAHGVQDFSLRRVAATCGLSCAAPYKHFRDKQDFILAIIRHVNEQWYARQASARDANIGDPRRQLVAISLEYIRFLIENPSFRSVIMQSDAGLTPEQRQEKSQLSDVTRHIIRKYCDQAGMDSATEQAKTFVVRSLIYGAALLTDNGELPTDNAALDLAARAIEREFELD